MSRSKANDGFGVLPGMGEETEAEPERQPQTPPKRIRWSIGERAAMRLALLDICRDPSQDAAHLTVEHSLNYLTIEQLGLVAGVLSSMVADRK